MSHLEAYVIYLPREGDVNFDLLVKVLSGYYTVQLLFFPLVTNNCSVGDTL